MPNINLHESAWHDERQPTAPAHFRRITERVAAQDRRWFTAHPGKDCYVRPYVPGELWPGIPPAAAADTVVLVTQMVPGIRSGQPLLHLVRRPGLRMTVIDPVSGSVLVDMPMEGWSDA